jgi:outer membrane protein
MKEKMHYVIEAVLAIAVVVLFVFQFAGDKKSSTVGAKSAANESSSSERMPIAFVDVDSLMTDYTYSIDLNEQMAKKYENLRANLTEKMRKFEAEATDFQRKYETGSFLSRERAEVASQQLIKKREDLKLLEAELSQELGAEQLRLHEDLRNTIIMHLREYNRDKNFQLIYGKMNDNILYADGAYDITGEVIEFLNRKYAASPANN